MKINFNNRKEEMGSKLKALIQGKNPQSQDGGNDLRYPKLKNKHFKGIRTKNHWWVELKSFLVFVVLAGFAAFVFYKCLKPFIEQGITTRRLLLYFGLFAIVFVGLVVVAWLLIKSSVKHHEEQDERDNKTLAFKQKMLESVFELENRKFIAEKHCLEKTLLLKEKEFMYGLDEKQREDDHRRKVQLKRYEIVEEYMKHVVDLAKTGPVIDLQQILNIIGKEEQPDPNGEREKIKPAEGEGEHDDPEKKNQGQQVSTDETEEEQPKEEVDPEPSEEKPDAESTPTEDQIKGKSDNQDQE